MDFKPHWMCGCGRLPTSSPAEPTSSSSAASTPPSILSADGYAAFPFSAIILNTFFGVYMMRRYLHEIHSHHISHIPFASLCVASHRFSVGRGCQSWPAGSSTSQLGPFFTTSLGSTIVKAIGSRSACRSPPLLPPPPPRRTIEPCSTTRIRSARERAIPRPREQSRQCARGTPRATTRQLTVEHKRAQQGQHGPHNHTTHISFLPPMATLPENKVGKRSQPHPIVGKAIRLGPYTVEALASCASTRHRPGQSYLQPHWGLGGLSGW